MEQVLLSFYRLDMSLLFSISISSHRRARKFPAFSLSLSLSSLLLCLAQHFQKKTVWV